MYRSVSEKSEIAQTGSILAEYFHKIKKFGYADENEIFKIFIIIFGDLKAALKIEKFLQLLSFLYAGFSAFLKK